MKKTLLRYSGDGNVYYLFRTFAECGEVSDFLYKRYPDQSQRAILSKTTPSAWEPCPLS